MTLPLPPGQTPRRWQLAAVDAVARAMGPPHRARRVLVSAATGTGKGTLLASLAVRAACKAPTARVLVLCHRRELLEDLHRRALAIVRGLPSPLAASLTCGLVVASDNAARARIVIGSVQTLKPARLAEVLSHGAPTLVIVDEAHHAPAASYMRVMGAVEAALGRPPHVLGLTATPYRTGKNGQTEGLGDAFDALVYEHGIVSAIREGDLVRPEAVRVDLHMALDLSQVRLGAGGDYDEEELEKAVDVDARNEAIADYVAERLGERQALGFAVSIAHARRLAEALKARGVKAEAVWGGTKANPLPAATRAALISRFQRGDLQVLISRDLLFEGFDSPAVEVLIAARPTQSAIIAAQLIGRGLRRHAFADGRQKSICEVWDFCGFVDGVRLDLGADMSTPAAAAAAAAAQVRGLEPGDLCELVLPPSRGVGCVQRAAADDPIVRVLWPDGEELAHGRPELRRVRPGSSEGPALPLVVRGQTETRVYLLPCSPEDRASQRPWVWAVDAWVCSAVVRRADPDAKTKDVRARGLVREIAPDRWEAWVGVWQGRDMSPEAPLARLPATARGVPLAAAQRAVDAALDDVGARRGGWDAAWRAEPATERQVQALRAMGRRQVAGLGKGEAGDLLDAQIVRRAVKERRQREQALQDATGAMRVKPDDTRSGAEGGNDGEE
jgi:superfamily II DNA or RNA helicase